MNQLFLLFVKLLIAMSAFLISACDDKLHNIERAAAAKSSSKVKDTPEVRNMLAAFAKQAHRIEFNGCNMRYNGKPFELGMTIKELVDIFGPYDLFNRGFYVWKAAGIVFAEKSRKERIENPSGYLYIYMNDIRGGPSEDPRLKHTLYKKYDYILFEGIPMSKNSTVKSFFNISKFELGDFFISNNAYDILYPCNTNLNIKYSFGSKGTWIYKGGGHLQLKSHPNKNNSNKFESLFIKFVTKL